MRIREVTERVRREGQRLARRASAWGRRAGVLPYEPERWSTDQWTDAYRAGTLDYYGGLDELARYSVIVGYIGWFATTCHRPPSVLDIGCGVGLLRSRLESVPFSDYVGVDLSDAAIHAATARAHTRSRFVVGGLLLPRSRLLRCRRAQRGSLLRGRRRRVSRPSALGSGAGGHPARLHVAPPRRPEPLAHTRRRVRSHRPRRGAQPVQPDRHAGLAGQLFAGRRGSPRGKLASLRNLRSRTGS